MGRIIKQIHDLWNMLILPQQEVRSIPRLIECRNDHAEWESHIAPASPKLESEDIRSSHFSNADRGQTIGSGPSTYTELGVTWLYCF